MTIVVNMQISWSKIEKRMLSVSANRKRLGGSSFVLVQPQASNEGVELQFILY